MGKGNRLQRGKKYFQSLTWIRFFFFNEKKSNPNRKMGKVCKQATYRRKNPEDQPGCVQGLKLLGNRRKAHFSKLSFYHKPGKNSSLV